MFKLYATTGLVLYLSLLLFVVLREKKINSTYEFFFAGRQLPAWALAITFVASWWGAGSAISTADLSYTDGLGAFFYYGVPVLISTFLMILGAKAIRRIDYLTQGEMMKARYSSTAAKMLSLMILVFMIFNAASQMVGIGMFFGYYLEISYMPAILIGTIIVLIYSFFGGFRAVVITDIIQFVLLTAAAICVFSFGFYYAGGYSGIEAKALSLGKIDYMNMTSGIEKYLMYVITFGCSWMIQANVWQRISAAKNNKEAQNMAILSFFIYIPLYLMVVFTGMAGLVLFPTLPEGGIVAAIVKHFMPTFVGALVFVGIAAAIMSTMDSLINTGAMTLIIDLIPSKNSKASLSYSKFATLGVTLTALCIALKIRDILTISWIASDVITTGVFVPLILGFIWRRGNNKGAISSMIWGLIFCLYNLCIELGLKLPTLWTYGEVSQVIFGITISTILFISISLTTKPNYEKADAYIKKAGLINMFKN